MHANPKHHPTTPARHARRAGPPELPHTQRTCSPAQRGRAPEVAYGLCTRRSRLAGAPATGDEAACGTKARARDTGEPRQPRWPRCATLGGHHCREGPVLRAPLLMTSRRWRASASSANRNLPGATGRGPTASIPSALPHWQSHSPPRLLRRRRMTRQGHPVRRETRSMLHPSRTAATPMCLRVANANLRVARTRLRVAKRTLRVAKTKLRVAKTTI